MSFALNLVKLLVINKGYILIEMKVSLFFHGLDAEDHRIGFV